MPAFTTTNVVDSLDGVKRMHLVRMLVSAASVVAVNAACGTVLAISPDESTANDASATEGETGEGGTATGVGADLTPTTMDLLAGGATGMTLLVTLTRPSGVRTPVTVTIAGGSDVVVSPTAAMTTTATAAVFQLIATAVAVPRRFTVDVTVTDGTSTVTRPLTIRLARHYRVAENGPPAAIDTSAFGKQTFLVKAWGAGGGAPDGAAGGYAEGLLGLEPATYYVVVGGGARMGSGGAPGGGSSSIGAQGRGGGGYSGLFSKGPVAMVVDFGHALVIAGAGGGGCTASGSLFRGGAGGTTGALRAENGDGSPNSGALTTMGGLGGLGSGATGGEDGSPGGMLAGGNGGFDATRSGGGGGGGYWGGGGAGVDYGGAGACNGGGGGSSFVGLMATGVTTLGGRGVVPGNDGDALRAGAGSVAGDGAVLLIPQ